MSLYSRYIFPTLLDWSMGVAPIREQRARLVSKAAGKVLEVGFGTGLNLPHYTGDVTSLTALDTCAMLPQKVAKRLQEVTFPVEQVIASGEALPFAEGMFDCLVTTFTLCSIPKVEEALGEMRRVLRSGGIHLFLEHGRSDDARVARWQDRLNPFQTFWACGCNLNRRVDRLIENADLTMKEIERFHLRGTPRVVGEMYLGVAQRP